MGQIQAKLFNRRLGDLRNAVTLEDVRYLPGRYHELTEIEKVNGLVTWINPIV